MTRIIRTLAIAAALGRGGCATAAPPSPAITDAESLVRAMHDRYAGRWYQTLSFTQATTRVLPNDSVHMEVWREWAAIPGRLRIEMGRRKRAGWRCSPTTAATRCSTAAWCAGWGG